MQKKKKNQCQDTSKPGSSDKICCLKSKYLIVPKRVRSHSKSQLIQCPLAPSMVQVIPEVQFGSSGRFKNTEYSLLFFFFTELKINLYQNWKKSMRTPCIVNLLLCVLHLFCCIFDIYRMYKIIIYS